MDRPNEKSGKVWAILYKPTGRMVFKYWTKNYNKSKAFFSEKRYALRAIKEHIIPNWEFAREKDFEIIPLGYRQDFC
jgi:hypothetical protein